MNYFENEIMRRVKELDCSAVYREHNDEISVMYDGVKIAEISYETAEKYRELPMKSRRNFSISSGCARMFQITAPLTKTANL